MDVAELCKTICVDFYILEWGASRLQNLKGAMTEIRLRNTVLAD